LFASLTPQQRWQLSVRPPVLQPVPLGSESRDDDPVSRAATPGPGPDDLAAEEQERQRLLAALVQLPAGQRLLLRLRYEQGLTLAEVARLTGQPDPFRANRQIQAAVDALAELMSRPDTRRRKSR
jgi:RNA polymerase sigma factor (sigma-70 family)